jgi:hypothetical protein
VIGRNVLIGIVLALCFQRHFPHRLLSLSTSSPLRFS